MTSQHQTTVVVKNPSGIAPLHVSMQGSLPQKAKKYLDYINDSPVGSMRPNGLGSIGGGQFDWKRRFVFIADAPTTIEVIARDSNFIVEELELVEYADTGPTWEAKSPALAPARVGVKYQLDADTRIAIRIDQKDESLDGAYVNLRQLGDAHIKIVQQEERECWKVSRLASWTAPTPAGEIAPGTSRAFTISDSSRLVVATDSEKDVRLEFANTNILHTLRLLNADADGTETLVANIGHGQSQAANTGANTIWTPGLNLQAGQVVVRKGVLAIIQQSPQ
jgi:hypothetical protein